MVEFKSFRPRLSVFRWQTCARKHRNKFECDSRGHYPLAFGLPATVPFTRIGFAVRDTVTWIGVGSERFRKSGEDDFKDRIEN